MKLRKKPPSIPKRNVLLYGPPKTGKTLAAASAEGPVLYLNADLPNATWLAHQTMPEGHILEPEFDPSVKAPVFTLMQEVQDQVNKGAVQGGAQTVVIDPINELYLSLLRELSGDAISPTLPTYQAVGTHIERLARACCKSPHVNLVLVTHDLPVKDEGSGRFINLPATGTQNPSLGRRLMGMVDVIGHTAAVPQEGTEDLAYIARVADRFNVLERIQPLDLNEWFKKLAGASERPTHPTNTAEGATPKADTGAKPEKEKAIA